MGFFDAPAFTTLFSFLGALCAQSVHIAVVGRSPQNHTVRQCVT